MGGITQANISAIVWEVCKTRPLTGSRSAAFLWFHLSPPLRLFFLGHAGGASESLYTLQSSPESSFRTSGEGGGSGPGTVVPVFEFACPTSWWATHLGRAHSCNLLTQLFPGVREPQPRARTQCGIGKGKEKRPGNSIPWAFGGAHQGLRRVRKFCETL